MTPIAFIPFEFPGLARVGMAFTTRQGGASVFPYDHANLSFDVGDDPVAVRANRAALKERFSLAELVDCTQVHEDTVNFDLAEGVQCQGDGLATSRQGVGLMAKAADCQPILLAHESGLQVAALHVGWRGNVIDFPGTGVQLFCEKYGCDPAQLFAVRGPSLGPSNAEFTNFSEEFGSEFDDFYDPVQRTVDLWALARAQLIRAGLLPERVFGLKLCTVSRPETFFSYRAKRTTGRQAGIIWIKPD